MKKFFILIFLFSILFIRETNADIKICDWLDMSLNEIEKIIQCENWNILKSIEWIESFSWVYSNIPPWYFWTNFINTKNLEKSLYSIPIWYFWSNHNKQIDKETSYIMPVWYFWINFTKDNWKTEESYIIPIWYFWNYIWKILELPKPEKIKIASDTNNPQPYIFNITDNNEEVQVNTWTGSNQEIKNEEIIITIDIPIEEENEEENLEETDLVTSTITNWWWSSSWNSSSSSFLLNNDIKIEIEEEITYEKYLMQKFEEFSEEEYKSKWYSKEEYEEFIEILVESLCYGESISKKIISKENQERMNELLKNSNFENGTWYLTLNYLTQINEIYNNGNYNNTIKGKLLIIIRECLSKNLISN